MTCFHPMTAYRKKQGGRLTFDANHPDVICAQQIPCGQCFGCRRDRAMRWGIRCMHEASLYPGPFSSIFINPTYDDEHMPAYRSLQKRDTQLFMMRLRKHIYPLKVRFFMAGEYSPFNVQRPENGLRPHCHGMLFGWNFTDRKPWRKSQTGKQLYRSPTLEKLWPFGQVLFGAVTFESAAYTARYAMKKLNGELGREAYRIVDQYGQPIPKLNEATGEQAVDEETGELEWLEREKEYAHMSTRPGIGAGWLEKYEKQTFAWDYVIVNGRKSPVPQYYDRLFERKDPERLAEIRYQRVKKGEEHAADNTPERLAVREQCARAKANFYERGRS